MFTEIKRSIRILPNNEVNKGLHKKSQHFRICCMLITLLPLILFSVCSALDFHSGDQYMFTINANNDGGYEYQWSASSGNYNENDKNTFIWAAPIVNVPTEVIISVAVTDIACDCHATLPETITVLPAEKKDTEEKSISNGTNLTQFNNSSTEIPQNLSIGSYNENISIPSENETEQAPASNATETINETANSILNDIKSTNSLLGLENSTTENTLAEVQTNNTTEGEDPTQTGGDFEEKINATAEVEPASADNQEAIAEVSAILDVIKAESSQDEVDTFQVELNATDNPDASSEPIIEAGEIDQSAEGLLEAEATAEPSSSDVVAESSQGEAGTSQVEPNATDNPDASSEPLIEAVIPLEFSDGTQVNVVFVESSSSVGDVAYAVPSDGSGILGDDTLYGGSDAINNESSINATLMSQMIDQLIEQSDLPRNSTEINETATVPKAPEDDLIPEDTSAGQSAGGDVLDGGAADGVAGGGNNSANGATDTSEIVAEIAPVEETSSITEPSVVQSPTQELEGSGSTEDLQNSAIATGEPT